MNPKTEQLKDSIVRMVQEDTPIISPSGYSMSIEDLSFNLPPGAESISEQSRLKHSSGTLQGYLGGRVIIKDPDGNVISKSNNLKSLFPVPILTDRGTYIVNGSEKNIVSQMRVKPGVYARKGDNGNVSTNIMTESVTGNYVPNLSILYDPDKVKFEVNVKRGQGGTTFNGLAFFRAMGLSDAQIKSAIGNDYVADQIFEKGSRSKKTLSDLHKAIVGFPPTEQDPELVKSSIAMFLARGTFGSGTKNVQREMNTGDHNLSVETLSGALAKTFAVFRDAKPSDDMDDFRFKEVFDDNDQILQAIRSDWDVVRKQAEEQMEKYKESTTHNNVRSIGNIGKGVNTLFSKGKLVRSAEQTNPLAVNALFRQISQGGDGGLTEHTVRNAASARDIARNSFDRLDPVQTPESGKIGIVEHLAQGARVNNRTVEAPVYAVSGGRAQKSDEMYLTPEDEHEVYIAFNDSRYVEDTGSVLRFIKPVVPARYKGETVQARVSEINYIDRSPRDMFGYAANMIPFVAHNDGNRAMMGANMQTQAITLKNREKPFVSALTDAEGSVTYEEMIGEEMGKPIRTDFNGIVERVTENAITVTDEEGKAHEYEFHNYFPINQGFVNNDLKVKKGDAVKQGDMLAEGWQTKDGALALGVNARTAFLPYKGYNYEDGIVVSRSFANKMSTEEMDTIEVDIPLNWKGGKGSSVKKELAIYTRNANVASLDNDGIIKKGAHVRSGDIVAARLKPIDPESSDFEDMITRDADKLEWRYMPVRIDPGSYVEGEVKRITVVDSPEANIKQRVIITLVSSKPLKMGDKITGRHGNKGTITHIVEDDEMPISADDRKPFDILYSSLAVPSRKNVGQLLETNAGLIAERTGQPYLMKNFDHTEKDKVLSRLNEIGVPDGKVPILLREKDDDGSMVEVAVENPVTAGNMYIMKLKHKADEKIQARSNLEGRNPLSKTQMPGKTVGSSAGEKHNPQGIGHMELAAFNAHQAAWNILENSTLKSDGGGDKVTRMAIFDALATGNLDALDMNATPETLNVLSDSLKAAGLLVQPMNSGKEVKSFSDAFDSMAIRPMRSSEIIGLAGRDSEVKKAKLLNAKDIFNLVTKRKKKLGETTQDEKVTGGLIDPAIFGDRGDPNERQQWGYIQLGTPIPNPVLMSDASNNVYQTLTGLKRADMNRLMEGKSVIVIDPGNYDKIKGETAVINQIRQNMAEAGLKPGDMVDPKVLDQMSAEGKDILWRAGGEGLQSLLDNVNLNGALKDAQGRLKDAKGKDIDKAYKEVKMLTSLKNNKMTPSDLMMHYMPVAPTYLRPTTSTDGGKNVSYDDLNKLYGNLIIANNPIKENIDGYDFFGSGERAEDAASATGNIYRRVSQIVGIGQNAKDRHSGAELANIKDSLGSKHGLVRGSMTGKRVDFSGRAVVGVDPKLGMDEVALPMDMAKTMYKPFVLRELVDRGYAANRSEALDRWEKMDEYARKALSSVVADRPIFLNRQPTLHKHGVMAFNPIIKDTENGDPMRTIQANPLVNEAFNLDLDGDCILNTVYARSTMFDIESLIGYNQAKGGDLMPFSQSEKIRSNAGVINLGDFPRGELKETKGNKDIYFVPEGTEVLTVWNGEKQWLPVETFSVHKNLDMLEVTTNSGRTVHCSDDHSLVSVDENLDYKRCAAEIGMTMPRVREVSEMNSCELKTIKINSENEAKYKFPSEIPVDFDLGYFTGAYIGDGWVSKEPGNKNGGQKVHLASVHDEIVGAISHYMTGLLGGASVHMTQQEDYNQDFYDGKYKRRKNIFSSRAFSDYLRENIGCGAQNKHLPPFWMKSDKSFRWGLLSGMLDTDGSVAVCKAKVKSTTQTNATYVTSSRRLAYELVAMGHSLDLSPAVGITESARGAASYTVMFTQEDIEKMQKKVVLRHKNKREALSSFKPGRWYKRGKYTPKLTSERLDELKKIIPNKNLKNKKGEPLTTDPGEIEKIKKYNTLYQIVYRTKKEKTAVPRSTALELFELNPVFFEENDFWRKWRDMVLDESIEWELLTNIRAIPFITEAYDLTVPPAYTMVTESGIVVYDTMSVHVPITEKAKEEAKQMMRPSQNLVNMTTGQVYAGIRHEMALGVYHLTSKNDSPKGEGISFNSHAELRKAYKMGRVNADTLVSIPGANNVTAGAALYNMIIPKQYRDFNKTWGKKEVEDMISDMYMEGEENNWKGSSKQSIAATINKIKDLGFEAATRSGVSIGTSDFQKLSVGDDIIKKNVDASIAQFGDTDEALITGWRNAEGEIEREIKSGNLMKKDDPLNIMMASGARAKADQIRRMVFTTGVGMDISGNLIKPIEHSHFDGLSPGEYWTHGKDARKGMSDRSVSTSVPGVITREVNMGHQDTSIVEKDCKTKNYILMDTSNKGIVGRVAADDVVGEDLTIYVRRNGIITRDVRNQLYKDSSVSQIKVRSPLKCQSEDGVCQKCYGTEPGTMQFPRVGAPIGIIASQAVGEPTTQMTMNTFHGGGTSSSASLGVPRIKELLSLNENPANVAVLAAKTGRVERVDEGIRSNTVWISGKAHEVPHLDNKPRSLKVAVGDTVTKGDFLTRGDTSDLKNYQDDFILTNADPRKMFQLRSSEVGQDRAVDELQDYLATSMAFTFDKTIGKGSIDPRHVETIVGKMTSMAKVIDPGDSSFMKGQEVDKNRLDRWNIESTGAFSSKKQSVLGVASISGKKAGADYKDKAGKIIVAEGELINDQAAQALIDAGHTQVKLAPREIIYEVNPLSTNQLVYTGNDRWFSNLGTTDVYKHVRTGTALGQVDPLSDPRGRQMAGKLPNMGKALELPGRIRDSVSDRMKSFFERG